LRKLDFLLEIFGRKSPLFAWARDLQRQEWVESWDYSISLSPGLTCSFA